MKFYGIDYDISASPALISPFCDHGNILAYLKNHPASRILGIKGFTRGSQTPGSLPYMAPELFEDNSTKDGPIRVSKETDTYAFSIVGARVKIVHDIAKIDPNS